MKIIKFINWMNEWRKEEKKIQLKKQGKRDSDRKNEITTEKIDGEQQVSLENHTTIFRCRYSLYNKIRS